MADRVLEQLDRLQNGAREMRPRGREHDQYQSFGRYDAYESEPADYGREEVYGDENAFPTDLHGTRAQITMPHSSLTRSSASGSMAYHDRYDERPSHGSQMLPPQMIPRHPHPLVSAARESSTQPFDLCE